MDSKSNMKNSSDNNNDNNNKTCPFQQQQPSSSSKSKCPFTNNSEQYLSPSARRVERLVSHLKANHTATVTDEINSKPRTIYDLPGPGREDTDAYYAQNQAYIQSLHEKYGDEVIVYRDDKPVLFFRSPACVKGVLTSASNFGKVWQTGDGPKASETTDYVHNLLQPLRANSVFNMHGEENAKRRRGFRTVFLGSESFAKTFVKVIDNGLLQWKHEGLGEVNIFNKTHQLIRNAIFVIICGDESPQLRDLVKDVFTESVSYFVARYANPPTAKSPPTINKEDEDLCNRIEDDAQKVVQKFKKILAEKYGNNTSAIPQATKTSLLMKMMNENYSDEEMAAMLVNVLIAAEEAVTSALAQTLQEFAYNPEVTNNVLKEAMEKDAEILEGKAEELEYITDCALEGLRLFAPATLVKRQARKDTVVNGILIPTDTVIELCITAIHQDPKIFPNPGKYDPMRTGLDHYMLGNEQTFMSFSGGERGCPGRHLALTILTLSIARIVKQFHLLPSTIKPRWEAQGVPKFVVWPLNGIPLNIQSRGQGGGVAAHVSGNRTSAPLPALNGINVMMDTKSRATIGLIQLPSDIPLDMEAPYLLDQIPDLRYRMSKMIFDDGDEDISHEVYSRAKKNLSKAAKSFLPNDITRYGSLDVIAMCCTSLSFSLGPNTVQSELRKGYPAAKQFTDMATASANAIKHVVSGGGGGKKLNRRLRIGLLTPYIESVHNSNVSFLRDNGIDVIVQHNLGLTQDTYTSSVAPKSISDIVQAIVKHHSNENLDAFFIGCSAFRSTGYGFIDQLEQAINIPVVTSNQAVLWQSLVLCEQITKKDLQGVKGYGKLFSL